MIALTPAWVGLLDADGEVDLTTVLPWDETAGAILPIRTGMYYGWGALSTDGALLFRQWAAKAVQPDDVIRIEPGALQIRFTSS